MATPKPAVYTQRGLAAGYRYQDLLASLAVCELLMRGSGTLDIESGRFEGDPFDDFVLRLDTEERIQAKHSEPLDPLHERQFMGKDARLPIASLVAGRIASPGRVRALSTWTTPPTIPDWLRPASTPTFFPFGVAYELDASVLWPVGAAPLWTQLGAVARDDFVAFADRFVLELDLPPMSKSLAAPGPCEEFLLRAVREVGVERHPNNRKAVDVASRILEVVSSGRGRRDRSFSFADLTHEIGLEIDRGRVPQAYPLDQERYVEPGLSTKTLTEALVAQPRSVVVGEPGAGKSWALETLARELPRAEWVVARHYCFLSPGDPHVQARVAVEAMTGNLLYELLEDRELAGLRVGLGGDVSDLETGLERAADAVAAGSGRRIALIVDGLDHVARVEVDPAQRRWRPDDFAEVLAQLDLPDSVSLVVGSQPGVHLKRFWDQGATELAVAGFTEPQVELQLARLGLLDRMRENDLAADIEQLIPSVTAQAAGNPLYVTFLAEQIRGWMEAGLTDLPSVLIADVPAPAGDLRAYYEYLLDKDSEGVAGMVVEHLALIDFSVTLDDLVGMLPTVGKPRLEIALSASRPVLARAAAQGGYRVYHESLRRHVTSRLKDQDRSPQPILETVIGWLDRQGFYGDARAFRHLLPLQRSAGSTAEILARLTPDFVGEAIVHLQPASAVEANIKLAAFVAAESGDLPKLAALSELRRAAHTAYEEKLSDITTYAEACIDLFGADRLAQQLTYEDRPVYGFDDGLELCALVDKRGGTAPWSAYRVARRIEPRVGAVDPHEARLRREINKARAAMRIEGAASVVPRIAALLLNAKPRPQADYLSQLADAVNDVLGAEVHAEILALANGADPERLVPFQICAAEAATATDDGERARGLAAEAAKFQLDADELLRVHACGIPASELVARLPDEQSVADAVLAQKHSADAEAVAVLRAAVVLWHEAGVDLAGLRNRFAGSGWYRRWLRFTVDITTATSSADVVAALEEVARDTAPFVGEPRACDLYGIHSQTRSSFATAFAALDDGDIPAGLDAVLRVSLGTTTYLQRSPGGPLSMWAVLEVLLPHASRIPREVVAEWIDRRWRSEYYELHAEGLLGLARIHMAAGDPVAAQEAWRRAGEYLSGYGMRKDVTLFGAIEALEPQPQSRRDEVVERLERLRPLVDRALFHTDGKETKYLPRAWMQAFADCAPDLAANLLATTFRGHPPTAYWIHEEALPDVIAAGQDSIPPLLAHSLWRCTPATRRPNRWLDAVDALAATDPHRAEEAFAEAAAAMDGDPEGSSDDTADLLKTTAADHGWPDPGAGAVPETRPSSGGSSPTPARGHKTLDQGPFLDSVTSVMSLMAWARGFSLDPYDKPIDHDALAAELEGKFAELGLDADQITAVGETLSRRQLSVRRGVVFEALAQARAEHEPGLAADLYVLGWCTSRGGGGWERFGGLDHRDLLELAAKCDQAVALSRLAIEVAHAIERDSYSLGMTRRICEALIVLGELDLALAVFDAATDVIEYRLPSTGGESQTWSGPAVQPSSHEEAYSRLLAACLRHPDQDRRAAALAGWAELLQADTALATIAAEWTNEADSTYVDLLGSWQVVQASGAAGEAVATALQGLLEAGANGLGYGLRLVAGQLLDAIGAPTALQSPPPIERTSVSASEVDEIAHWDPGDRLDVLERGWRGVRRLVAERYAWIWTEAYDDIATSQVELQFSRAHTWVPPKPQHHWTAEIFECALHDAFPEFRRQLVVKGWWSGETERTLTALLLPQAATSTSRGRSRIVRLQDIPLPGSVVAGRGAMIEVTVGRYRGWTVAGYWEREIVETSHSGAGHLRRVHAGVAGAGTSSATPPGLPFGWLGGTFPWHDQGAHDQGSARGPGAHWPVGCWVQHDVHGWERGLTLRPDLVGALGLKAAQLPAPLDLVDEEGRAQAVWRRWWMRPYSYDYGPTTPMISGGALLLSPTALFALERQLGEPLVLEVTVEQDELHERH